MQNDPTNNGTPKPTPVNPSSPFAATVGIDSKHNFTINPEFYEANQYGVAEPITDIADIARNYGFINPKTGVRERIDTYRNTKGQLSVFPRYDNNKTLDNVYARQALDREFPGWEDSQKRVDYMIDKRFNELFNRQNTSVMFGVDSVNGLEFIEVDNPEKIIEYYEKGYRPVNESYARNYEDNMITSWLKSGENSARSFMDIFVTAGAFAENTWGGNQLEALRIASKGFREDLRSESSKGIGNFESIVANIIESAPSTIAFSSLGGVGGFAAVTAARGAQVGVGLLSARAAVGIASNMNKIAKVGQFGLGMGLAGGGGLSYAFAREHGLNRDHAALIGLATAPALGLLYSLGGNVLDNKLMTKIQKDVVSSTAKAMKEGAEITSKGGFANLTRNATRKIFDVYNSLGTSRNKFKAYAGLMFEEGIEEGFEQVLNNVSGMIYDKFFIEPNEEKKFNIDDPTKGFAENFILGGLSAGLAKVYMGTNGNKKLLKAYQQIQAENHKERLEKLYDQNGDINQVEEVLADLVKDGQLDEESANEIFKDLSVYDRVVTNNQSLFEQLDKEIESSYNGDNLESYKKGSRNALVSTLTAHAKKISQINEINKKLKKATSEESPGLEALKSKLIEELAPLQEEIDNLKSGESLKIAKLGAQFMNRGIKLDPKYLINRLKTIDKQYKDKEAVIKRVTENFEQVSKNLDINLGELQKMDSVNESNLGFIKALSKFPVVSETGLPYLTKESVELANKKIDQIKSTLLTSDQLELLEASESIEPEFAKLQKEATIALEQLRSNLATTQNAVNNEEAEIARKNPKDYFIYKELMDPLERQVELLEKALEYPEAFDNIYLLEAMSEFAEDIGKGLESLSSETSFNDEPTIFAASKLSGDVLNLAFDRLGKITRLIKEANNLINSNRQKEENKLVDARLKVILSSHVKLSELQKLIPNDQNLKYLIEDLELAISADSEESSRIEKIDKAYKELVNFESKVFKDPSIADFYVKVLLEQILEKQPAILKAITKNGIPDGYRRSTTFSSGNIIANRLYFGTIDYSDPNYLLYQTFRYIKGLTTIDTNSLVQFEKANLTTRATPYPLSSEQFEAARQALTYLLDNQNIFVTGAEDISAFKAANLTGLFGSGKTITAKFIIDYILEKTTDDVIVTSPFRANEATSSNFENVYNSEKNSRLIHSKETADEYGGLGNLLGLVKSYKEAGKSVTVVVDESSMLTEPQLKSLISLANSADGGKIKLLFVGDVGQLTYAANVSFPIIDSFLLRKTDTLTTTYRSNNNALYNLISQYRDRVEDTIYALRSGSSLTGQKNKFVYPDTTHYTESKEGYLGVKVYDTNNSTNDLRIPNEAVNKFKELMNSGHNPTWVFYNSAEQEANEFYKKSLRDLLGDNASVLTANEATGLSLDYVFVDIKPDNQIANTFNIAMATSLARARKAAFVINYDPTAELKTDESEVVKYSAPEKDKLFEARKGFLNYLLAQSLIKEDTNKEDPLNDSKETTVDTEYIQKSLDNDNRVAANIYSAVLASLDMSNITYEENAKQLREELRISIFSYLSTGANIDTKKLIEFTRKLRDNEVQEAESGVDLPTEVTAIINKIISFNKQQDPENLVQEDTPEIEQPEQETRLVTNEQVVSRSIRINPFQKDFKKTGKAARMRRYQTEPFEEVFKDAAKSINLDNKLIDKIPLGKAVKTIFTASDQNIFISVEIDGKLTRVAYISISETSNQDSLGVTTLLERIKNSPNQQLEQDVKYTNPRYYVDFDGKRSGNLSLINFSDFLKVYENEFDSFDVQFKTRITDLTETVSFPSRTARIVVNNNPLTTAELLVIGKTVTKDNIREIKKNSMGQTLLSGMRWYMKNSGISKFSVVDKNNQSNKIDLNLTVSEKGRNHIEFLMTFKGKTTTHSIEDLKGLNPQESSTLLKEKFSQLDTFFSGIDWNSLNFITEDRTLDYSEFVSSMVVMLESGSQPFLFEQFEPNIKDFAHLYEITPAFLYKNLTIESFDDVALGASQTSVNNRSTIGELERAHKMNDAEVPTDTFEEFEFSATSSNTEELDTIKNICD